MTSSRYLQVPPRITNNSLRPAVTTSHSSPSISHRRHDDRPFGKQRANHPQASPRHHELEEPHSFHTYQERRTTKMLDSTMDELDAVFFDDEFEKRLLAYAERLQTSSSSPPPLHERYSRCILATGARLMHLQNLPVDTCKCWPLLPATSLPNRRVVRSLSCVAPPKPPSTPPDERRSSNVERLADWRRNSLEDLPVGAPGCKCRCKCGRLYTPEIPSEFDVRGRRATGRSSFRRSRSGRSPARSPVFAGRSRSTSLAPSRSLNFYSDTSLPNSSSSSVSSASLPTPPSSSLSTSPTAAAAVATVCEKTRRLYPFRRTWSLFALGMDSSEKETPKERPEKAPPKKILRPPTRHIYRKGISGLPIECNSMTKSYSALVHL